jgi:hypothetical protein
MTFTSNFVASSAAPWARHLLAGALVVAATGAQAVPYRLDYTGTFNTTESLNLASASGRTFFSGTTPFTITAFYDDSSPNVLPPAFPFLGFHAYVPTLATIQIGGTTYTIETAATNATAGVTVSIFDRSQIFNPGRYGIGLIANVLSDGAGIVGDFSGASPEFTVGALTPTTFTDYFGVGHGSTSISGNPPAAPPRHALGAARQRQRRLEPDARQLRRRLSGPAPRQRCHDGRRLEYRRDHRRARAGHRGPDAGRAGRRRRHGAHAAQQDKLGRTASPGPARRPRAGSPLTAAAAGAVSLASALVDDLLALGVEQAFGVSGGAMALSGTRCRRAGCACAHVVTRAARRSRRPRRRSPPAARCSCSPPPDPG